MGITIVLAQALPLMTSCLRSASEYQTTPPGFTGPQLSPPSGLPGTKVTLSGTNFTGATAVLFNGVGASFTNHSANNLDLRITAVVPPDATSSPITIRTPHGDVTTTAVFTVLPLPALAFTQSSDNPSPPSRSQRNPPANDSTYRGLSAPSASTIDFKASGISP